MGHSPMELKNLIRKRDTMTNELDHGVCKKWKELEEESKIDVLHRCQSQGKNTWIHLSYFDIDDVGTEQKLRWCDGVVEAISDGTWLVPGSRRKKDKVGEAASILWDVIPDCKDKGEASSMEVLAQSKRNKNSKGVWRMDVGEVYHGL